MWFTPVPRCITYTNPFSPVARGFARMTGRAGKLQHFRYGVAKVRGRWYYRYHKPIGRANWKGYQERYLRPKDVEAKQRLVFAPKATTAQLRQSISWEWRMPKLLAQATTCNQVLDAWVLFRYRQPKKVYHYMGALKRLSELGGCEPSDWRLQVLISRMQKLYKRVVGIDVLVKYFAKLGLYKEIEYVSRFLYPRIANLTVAQQVSILHSFGHVKLRDPRVTGLLVRHLRRNLDQLTLTDKLKVIESLGRMEIRQSVFVSQLTDSIIGSSVTSSSIPLTVYFDLIRGLGLCGVRHYPVAELAADACMQLLVSGCISPPHANLICQIVHELSRQGIVQTGLVNSVIANINPLSVSVSALVGVISGAIGIVDAQLLVPHVIALRSSICLLNEACLIVDTAKVVDFMIPVLADGKVLFEELALQYVNGLPHSPIPYNVADLGDVFARNAIYTEGLWTRLSKDLKLSLENFEPKDFTKLGNALASVPADVLSREAMADVSADVAMWALKRRNDFSKQDWSEMGKTLRKDQLHCSPKLVSKLDSNCASK